MEVSFFDSSALVKRYLTETGSSWVVARTDPLSGNEVRVAGTTIVEVIAAITRRERGGSIPAADARASRAAFRDDLRSEYHVTDLNRPLIDEAKDLAEQHGLRGADAIQLAAALDVFEECVALGLPLTFVSADLELNAAASAEVLAVDDPNAYP